MISDLQKEIFHLALEKRFITFEEILVELWGWESGAGWGRKKAIGERKYARGHASLSRSITRLWSKNLVIIWKTITNSRTAISLTPEGKTIALGILAETGKSRIRG
jgi:hypothetical protein